MSALASWDELKQGNGCPFDPPRSGIDGFMCRVRSLSVSTLYLSREQTYRGLCVLIFDPRHVTRIDELSAEEWAAFSQDLGESERAVYRTFEPDHINVATLGSVVPHLHWHIVPRYRTDPRWGAPIWTSNLDDMPRTELEAPEYDRLVASIDESFR